MRMVFVRTKKTPSVAKCGPGFWGVSFWADNKELLCLDPDKIKAAKFDGEWYYLQVDDPAAAKHAVQPPAWALDCEVKREKSHFYRTRCPKCGKEYDTDTVKEVILEDGVFECKRCGTPVWPAERKSIRISVPEGWLEKLAQNIAKQEGMTKLVGKYYKGAGEEIVWRPLEEKKEENKVVRVEKGENPEIHYSNWEFGVKDAIEASYKGKHLLVWVENPLRGSTEGFLFSRYSLRR